MVDGEELRIPVSEDGHFWVDAEVNGHEARFLVDSGASITTVSSETARDGRPGPSACAWTWSKPPTASCACGGATAERFKLGPIERTDFSVNINERDSSNVLGMNFLSSLGSWGVQGNYLVLQA